MAQINFKRFILNVIFVIFVNNVSECRSLEYLDESLRVVKDFAYSAAPNFYGLGSCILDDNVSLCARSRAGKILDSWEDEIVKERRHWAAAADTEVKSVGGRSDAASAEVPSRIGSEVESSLNSFNDLVQNSLARTLARKKGGSSTITIMADSEGHMKKKKKKDKQKPQKIHLIHAPRKPVREDKGVAELHAPREGQALEGGRVDHAVSRVVHGKGDYVDDEFDVAESRGKKKKKKKAILKLLILGAVLKAKIGLLLQILSAHLQVKFFAIALAGLAINIARFWFDLKKGGTPQKVIYYEHAQHQHHYEHEDADNNGWGSGGYWSRNYGPQANGKTDQLVEQDRSFKMNSPYSGWIGRNYST